MCLFCAAVPVAGATGTALNHKQLEASRAAKTAGLREPLNKPVMKITAGVIVLLMIGSVTYHALTSLPY